MDRYEPYEYNCAKLDIYNYLILKKGQSTNNIFDLSLDESVRTEVESIHRDGYEKYKIYNKQKTKNNKKLNSDKCFLYTEIKCVKKEKVIFYVDVDCGVKIWINNKIVYINSENASWERKCVVVEVNEGLNTLTAEISSDKMQNLNIKLLNYKKELSNDIKALCSCGSTLNIDDINYVYNGGEDYSNSKTFSFMLIPNDWKLYDNEVTVTVSDDVLGPDFYKPEFKDSFKSCLGQVCNLELDKYRKLCKFNKVIISCAVKTKDGKINTFKVGIIIKSFDVNQTIQDSLELKKKCDDFTKLQLTALTDILKKSNDATVNFNCWKLYELIYKIKSNRNIKDEIYEPGVHEFYYKSLIDNKNERILLRIPQNFNKNKKCPLIMQLSTRQYESYSYVIQDEKIAEPFIFVDVTQRGVTAGSMVSNASVLDTFNYLKSIYNIDEDRIYFSGCSNGGYGVWTLIQNYPDLAVAAFPLIGFPYLPNICNTYNTPIINFVSDKDYIFEGKMEYYKSKMKPNRNYKHIAIKGLDHFNMLIYNFNIYAFNYLLKYTRKKYPEEIIFRTERNRYLKSFWLELHGITFNKIYARIHAKINGENEINITVKNSTGFSVQLPPQINRKSFSITINGKIFRFKNFSNDEIHFIHKNGYQISENRPTKNVSRKGTGLLDVYVNRLRIIIPNDASEIISKSASKFSTPSSNGFDPIVHTEYPIYKENEFTQDFDSSFVIFNADYKNEKLKNIINNMPIKTDKNGFEYKGKRYDCNYCLLQVKANEYNPDFSILTVSTNDEKLLRSNLLTRRIIISSYCNGINPYWNEEVFIYMDNKYYSIYELGQDIKEITN